MNNGCEYCKSFVVDWGGGQEIYGTHCDCNNYQESKEPPSVTLYPAYHRDRRKLEEKNGTFECPDFELSGQDKLIYPWRHSWSDKDRLARIV